MSVRQQRRQRWRARRRFGVRVDMAANFDWEDIAIDGISLYIADVGNNGNARRDLGVYVLTEPNPEAVDRTRTRKWLPVAYPDQDTFRRPAALDCEAVFVFGGKLHFLTKHRASRHRHPGDRLEPVPFGLPTTPTA